MEFKPYHRIILLLAGLFFCASVQAFVAVYFLNDGEEVVSVQDIITTDNGYPMIKTGEQIFPSENLVIGVNVTSFSIVVGNKTYQITVPLTTSCTGDEYEEITIRMSTAKNIVLGVIITALQNGNEVS